MAERGNLEVHLAELEDAPQILSVFQQTAPLSTQADITLVSVLDWLEQADDQNPIFVVRERSSVLAWLAVEPYYGLAALAGVGEVALYVSPNVQRMGLGRTLLNTAINQQRRVGRTTLVAHIGSGNVASRAFFEDSGFCQWGSLPQVLCEPNLPQQDLIIYGLSLPGE
ncbi:GNAT family N-acetyltransferase [Maribrevibacterium harenarium]|uniref:GNAT family N-acetyltransferase n=1 Tax=Maribrevibacterium harenarium TaxID=2589817 RepID=A0A501X243_9GAMM|nr:GNAT family N-acetyltransferase [Maribrevibacterium harenarium]TPE54549.1 GNAT family N-acetyltransferase [Maribrevibacterium harenarium]